MSLFLVCNKTEERETVLIKKTATLSIAVICESVLGVDDNFFPVRPGVWQRFVGGV